MKLYQYQFLLFYTLISCLISRVFAETWESIQNAPITADICGDNHHFTPSIKYFQPNTNTLLQKLSPGATVDLRLSLNVSTCGGTQANIDQIWIRFQKPDFDLSEASVTTDTKYTVPVIPPAGEGDSDGSSGSTEDTGTPTEQTFLINSTKIDAQTLQASNFYIIRDGDALSGVDLAESDVGLWAAYDLVMKNVRVGALGGLYSIDILAVGTSAGSGGGGTSTGRSAVTSLSFTVAKPTYPGTATISTPSALVKYVPYNSTISIAAAPGAPAITTIGTPEAIRVAFDADMVKLRVDTCKIQGKTVVRTESEKVDGKITGYTVFFPTGVSTTERTYTLACEMAFIASNLKIVVELLVDDNNYKFAGVSGTLTSPAVTDTYTAITSSRQFSDNGYYGNPSTAFTFVLSHQVDTRVPVPVNYTTNLLSLSFTNGVALITCNERDIDVYQTSTAGQYVMTLIPADTVLTGTDTTITCTDLAINTTPPVPVVSRLSASPLTVPAFATSSPPVVSHVITSFTTTPVTENAVAYVGTPILYTFTLTFASYDISVLDEHVYMNFPTQNPELQNSEASNSGSFFPDTTALECTARTQGSVPIFAHTASFAGAQVLAVPFSAVEVNNNVFSFTCPLTFSRPVPALSGTAFIAQDFAAPRSHIYSGVVSLPQAYQPYLPINTVVTAAIENVPVAGSLSADWHSGTYGKPVMFTASFPSLRTVAWSKASKVEVAVDVAVVTPTVSCYEGVDESKMFVTVVNTTKNSFTVHVGTPARDTGFVFTCTGLRNPTVTEAEEKGYLHTYTHASFSMSVNEVALPMADEEETAIPIRYSEFTVEIYAKQKVVLGAPTPLYFDVKLSSPALISVPEETMVLRYTPSSSVLPVASPFPLKTLTSCTTITTTTTTPANTPIPVAVLRSLASPAVQFTLRGGMFGDGIITTEDDDQGSGNDDGNEARLVVQCMATFAENIPLQANAINTNTNTNRANAPAVSASSSPFASTSVLSGYARIYTADVGTDAADATHLLHFADTVTASVDLMSATRPLVSVTMTAGQVLQPLPDNALSVLVAAVRDRMQAWLNKEANADINAASASAATMRQGLSTIGAQESTEGQVLICQLARNTATVTTLPTPATPSSRASASRTASSGTPSLSSFTSLSSFSTLYTSLPNSISSSFSTSAFADSNLRVLADDADTPAPAPPTMYANTLTVQCYTATDAVAESTASAALAQLPVLTKACKAAVLPWLNPGSTLIVSSVTAGNISNICFNGVRDDSADESDVDCGGQCVQCTSGRQCTGDEDCIQTCETGSSTCLEVLREGANGAATRSVVTVMVTILVIFMGALVW